VRNDAGRAGITNPNSAAKRGDPVGPFACTKPS
jgi:hypothetical protein